MRIGRYAARAAVTGGVFVALLAGTATAAMAGDNNGNGLIDSGDTGEQVRCVQQIVAWEGIAVGAIDGIFGDRTFNGVWNYQAKFTLGRDGKVGPITGGHMSRRALDLQQRAQQVGETAIAARYREWRARCDSRLPG